jgi:hypothetical protein
MWCTNNFNKKRQDKNHWLDGKILEKIAPVFQSALKVPDISNSTSLVFSLTMNSLNQTIK